jgi:hypothetical protein
MSFLSAHFELCFLVVSLFLSYGKFAAQSVSAAGIVHWNHLLFLIFPKHKQHKRGAGRRQAHGQKWRDDVRKRMKIG